ncbi:MAG: hypothetical protein A2044_02940 [Candidatus Firestonebacteria bacterium GWA2_43_8]|nr:MAG: hypothetical protein A2044_02940 [Candidatus Firestonebacteria bacterium GWA2_43_8]
MIGLLERIRILLFVSLLSIPGQGNFAADKIPNPRLNLPDNTVVDLCEFEWEKPEGEPECGAVTDYSGMVYDPHNQRILLFGGGHSATYSDAIYSFDIKTLKWSSLYTPTPASSYQQSNMVNGAWQSGVPGGKYPRPVGRHTYDLLVVPDDRPELLMLRNGCNFSRAAPLIKNNWAYKGCTGVYNFKNNQWKINPVVPFGGFVGAAEYDPVSKKVIGTLQQTICTYDPVSGTSAIIMNGIQTKYGVSNYANSMVYFPPDKKMYVFSTSPKYEGNINVWSLELNRTDFPLSKVSVLTPKISGECLQRNCGFVYDSANKVIGGGVKDNKFYVFDPAALTWTAHTVQGGTPGTMTFYNIIYDPVNNVYIFIAGGRTWAYRLKKGTGSGASSTDNEAVIKAIREATGIEYEKVSELFNEKGSAKESVIAVCAAASITGLELKELHKSRKKVNTTYEFLNSLNMDPETKTKVNDLTKKIKDDILNTGSKVKQ